MSQWGMFSVLLVCCANTVVTDVIKEEMGSSSPLETMASCHISHECNMTEDGMVCHLSRHYQGKLTVYRLNSRGSILFQLMKGTQGGIEQKKMEMKTCSCQIAGYEKEFSNETSLLFVYNFRHLFFHEGHNMKRIHRASLDFSGRIDYLYADMSQCTFIWMYRLSKKHILSSMCFDGKGRKKIFEVKALCGFYDHIRRLHFSVDHRKLSYVIRVFSDPNNISDIFETPKRLDCECFAGHAASQTLVICTRAGIPPQYTLYTLNYTNIHEIVPRKVLEVYPLYLHVAILSPDKLAILYEMNTVYLFDIASNTKKAIVKCPLRTYEHPREGLWNSHVLIKCTGYKGTYIYSGTLDGVQTMPIKTIMSAKFVSVIA